MNKLEAAMASASLAELDAVADEIGRHAVASAIQIEHASQAEADRQRDLDAALADAIEVVARQRQRLGRRICTTHDGATARRIFEALRGMMAGNQAGPIAISTFSDSETHP